MNLVVEPELLASRLGADDASEEAVARRVRALSARFELSRPPPGSDADDPRVALFFLLSMARRSHRRALAPLSPVGAEAEAAFLGLVGERPQRDADLGQLHIDSGSAIRRAQITAATLEPGDEVLAVGDDDLTTLALRALDPERAVAAVDLDARLLAHLASHGVETHHVDLFAESVPMSLRRRFRAAVSDPFRDLDGGLGFLVFAAACVRPGGRLLWADHPDWSFEQPLVAHTMAELGWLVVEVHEDLHRYPLDTDAVRPDAICAALAIERDWLCSLIDVTCAFSNLYVLARGGSREAALQRAEE